MTSVRKSHQGVNMSGKTFNEHHKLKATQQSENILRISICPRKMTSAEQNAKKYKEDHMKEVVSDICALLNSGGGKLEIYFDGIESAPGQAVHDTHKMIEQKVSEMIGISKMTMNVISKALSRQIIFDVKQSHDLVTVRYNFCLPSQTQVIGVPSSEPIENVRNVLRVGDSKSQRFVIGSRRKVFTKGQNLGSFETSNVQFKNLKAEASKCIGLAERITSKSNKLTSYVSAFANRDGGHIYYGVTDGGIVEGEEISEKEKSRIINKVEKTIKKMVWPKSGGQVKKGIHWDIFFEPIKDDKGNSIPSIYVVVIYIAPCPGGVFMEIPESYHIVEGKIRKMSFSQWFTKLTGNPIPFANLVPQHILGNTNRRIRTI